MPKYHEKFHSADGKRLILIADDESINRAMLGEILKDEYELLYAEEGTSAYRMVEENKDYLSLVLLDIMMPGLSGLEILAKMKEDSRLQKIPVIVMTSEQKAELDSLNLGAMDFIPKPYPQPEIIRARVLKTIELSEDRDIIHLTERDELTGLYNKEFFFRYAEQYDQYHKDMLMDAVVVDINHFHMINERYGKAYGDEVLRSVGGRLREIASDQGGIICRRENDTFLIYCPHRNDYKTILDYASTCLAGEDKNATRVRLRMGIYSNVDKQIDIERRFDRAKMAADTVRNSYTKMIAEYDSMLHEEEIYEEQLLEDFHTAINERQFIVFYQPKFDIRPEIPVLASAEALIRWMHPKLGLISPGIFIPLFEENGLIRELDMYVWREAAAKIREWKEKYDIVVPVSVNVSRVDMYDMNLVDNLQNVLKEQGITASELLLEITESAYTQDAEQIIKIVNELRALGFKVEMDDFGTGYSSLNMISRLPIDALKLDMQFIRNAFNEQKDTRMLEVIIDIADYLSVPVIAEGVETEEQLISLKEMGCDMVQGYYFSKPLPPEEYEFFVEERQKRGTVAPAVSQRRRRAAEDDSGLRIGRIAYALSNGFESIYYVDMENDHYVEFSSKGKYADLQIQRSGSDFFADTKKNLEIVVYPDDRERVRLSLQKDVLEAHLLSSDSFSITYRLLIDGAPVYYNLKAVKASKADTDHVVIGVSNVANQMHQAIHDESENRHGLTFFNIAEILSNEFESVYCVDIATNSYTEYTAQGPYEKVKMEMSGENFFDDCQKNIRTAIALEDQAMMSRMLEKQTLLDILEKQDIFYLDYHLLVNDTPVPYRIKVVKSNDQLHILVGVSDWSKEKAIEQKFEAVTKDKVTYASIAQALAADFFSIYYIDTETNDFIEFSAHDDYKELGIEKRGKDFFNLSSNHIMRVVYEEDREMLCRAITKENILSELEANGVFTLTYRIMLNDEPTFVSMKVTSMMDKSDKHIVVGVNNIDAQMKREAELGAAREIANRDALTGVKSKHAYLETEQSLNRKMETGSTDPFAVVICDVNGLKQVNDTYGHKAGDKYLKNACMQICRVFKHSPVFRIGGDEFLALLSGKDYANRTELLAQMAALNEKHRTSGEVIIASGMAEYKPDMDRTVAAVFDRADAAMYKNKKSLKTER